MNKVVLDPEVSSKLTALNDQAELCDEKGQTLGFFLPPDLHRELLYAWANAQVTDEELEEARQEMRAQGGLTTAQVIAHLESLNRAGPDKV